MPNKLTYVRNKKDLDTLIQNCIKTGYASIDFETTSLNFKDYDQYPLLLGVSYQPGSSWIIPLGHKDSVFKKSYESKLRYFGKRVLENPDVVKVAWNLKFEYKWLMRYGILMKGRLFDSQLAKYLLDEEAPHNLKSFVVNFFEEFAGYENKLKEDSKESVDWKNIPFEELSEYCGIDTDTTLRAMYIMEPKIIKQGFYSMFRNMLMMITRVLAEAEYRGILIDKPYLKKLMDEYAEKIAKAKKDLQNDPALLKYEKIHKKKHLEALINKVTLEIQEITEKAPNNAAVLIRNREAKIKKYLEGSFNKKENYMGMNFSSPTQVRHFFFEAKYGLRLKPLKFTKNKKTGQRSETPSTDEETLLKLKPLDKTGFMTKLLDLRGLEKLNSTYIVGIWEKLDKWDRIHPGFKVAGTVTGRLSCANPNMQNIPRGTTAADIKRMFIPPKGKLWLEADYSQAELRIIAEVSGDKAMIDIFKKNYNIHIATACKMNKRLDDYEHIKNLMKKGDALGAHELANPKNKELLFWQKEKKKGKSLNFSIVYQQGDDATAETLGCTKEEAKQFKKDWFREFPQVKKWIDKQKALAHRKGYVKNIFGTKRRLHDINCGISWLEAEAERQAVNAPIQGGSGYFTLFSMVVIREKIIKGELPRDLLAMYTVHDSLGYSINPKDVHKVAPKIIEICNNPETEKYFGFKLQQVKMKVSEEIGRNWVETVDYDPWEDYSSWV